jgi:hypothetical protein
MTTAKSAKAPSALIPPDIDPAILASVLAQAYIFSGWFILV